MIFRIRHEKNKEEVGVPAERAAAAFIEKVRCFSVFFTFCLILTRCCSLLAYSQAREKEKETAKIKADARSVNVSPSSGNTQFCYFAR